IRDFHVTGVQTCALPIFDVCKNKLTKLKLYIDRGIRINVQVAVGSCTEQDLIDIMKACKEYNVSVLLLGWKETHRGKTAKRHDEIGRASCRERRRGAGAE